MKIRFEKKENEDDRNTSSFSIPIHERLVFYIIIEAFEESVDLSLIFCIFVFGI